MQEESARIFTNVGVEEKTEPKGDREHLANAHVEKTPSEEAGFSRLGDGISERPSARRTCSKT